MRPGWLWIPGAIVAVLLLAASCRSPAADVDTAAETPTPTFAATAPATAPPVRTPAPSRSEPGVPTPTPSKQRRATPSPPAPLAKFTVAVDPGHNGGNVEHPERINRLVDAGGFEKPCNTTGTATDHGYSEAEFNFEVALLMQRQLEALGAVVVLTRDDNNGVGPCIDERGRLGAEVGADVLVSVHADGAGAEDRGFHVIAPATVPGYTDDIDAASAALATELRDALVAAGFTPSTYRGTGGIDVRADLGTLNSSDIPAVIVEVGNMRNADDAAVMQSAAGRRRIAETLVTGIAGFLR